MRYIIASITVLLFICLAGGLFAQETVIENPLQFSNSRFDALGGLHAALLDDHMIVFNNPAGFQTDEPELLVSEITLGLMGPIFDVTNTILAAFSGGEGLLDNPDMIDLVASIFAGLDLVGPISMAYTGNGLGFGFFNWCDLMFKSKGSLNVNAVIQENILITGGYAFRIPINNMSLDLGIQLKALFRGTINMTKSVLEIFSDLQDNPMNLLLENKFVLSVGGGVDLGLRYSFGEFISFGVVARNLYTPTIRNVYNTLNEFLNAGTPTQAEGIIPLDLAGGILVRPPLGILGRVISELKVAADYNDILDFITHPETSKHWFLHIGVGAELSLLEILNIRVGFAQGLLAAGLGLDLTVFKMNASMFGSELSPSVGLRPEYNLVIGLEFAF